MNATHLFSRVRLLFARQQRPAKRIPAQRLTGFEPLEPRTVLSASGMHGHGNDDLLGGPPRDFYRGESHGRHLGWEIAGNVRHDKLEDRDTPTISYAAPIAIVQEPLVADSIFASPHEDETPLLRQPILEPLRPLVTPSLRPSDGAGDSPTTLIIVTAVVPVTIKFAPELVLYRDPAPMRIVMDFTGGMFANDSRSTSSYSAAAERRLESQPSFAIARLSNELSTSAEAGQAKVFEPGISHHTVSSLLLGPSSFLQVDSVRNHDSPDSTVQSGEGDFVNPTGGSDASASDADDGGELIELHAGDLPRQKRRSLADDSATRARISPRLSHLAETPLARDAQWLLSELQRLTDNEIWGQQPIQPLDVEATANDDLIELLAADVGSLMVPRGVLPVSVGPVAAARAMTLDAGVAIYQPLDLAQPDSGSSDLPPDAVPLTDAPAPERPTGAE